MRKLALIGLSFFALAAGTAEPQKIVFARVFPNAGQIGLFIAAADGSGERPLVGPGEIDYDPVWSPDGASIVFTSDRNGSADLYRVKPDGTGLERLTDNPAYDDQAAFSPDGKQLVFVTTRSGGTADLWTMDLQTQTREGADVRARRRLPAVVVAGRPVDRVLVRSRQHAAVRARPLGASAARRSLRDSSGRHRAEADHRARQLLRQPEVVGRQPARDRVLHGRRSRRSRPTAGPTPESDPATTRGSFDRHRDRRGDRRAGGTRREVQSVVRVGRRRRLHPQGRATAPGIYYTSGKTRTEGRRPSRVVVARRHARRRFTSGMTAPPTTWLKTCSRNPQLRADADRHPAVVQPGRRSVRDDRPAGARTALGASACRSRRPARTRPR